ncbi:MAG TPA: OB-fold domain-containing protein [Acidimicrobiales bacterium]|nr:OB-fold domain-containing protein [Acidimicrobiales bacterium]
MTSSVPAVEGWLSLEGEPALLGQKCSRCGTYQFPPTASWCPNPRCGSEELETVALSRNGTVWSYTDAQYQPPPPYVSPTEPYQPFAIAAVELAEERLVVLGQVAAGYGVADLHVGAPVELVAEPLDRADGAERAEGADRMVWRWKPTSPPQSGTKASSSGAVR